MKRLYPRRLWRGTTLFQPFPRNVSDRGLVLRTGRVQNMEGPRPALVNIKGTERKFTIMQLLHKESFLHNKAAVLS